MNQASLLSSVVHAMGLLVVAQDLATEAGEERFVWVGEVPAWAESFGCSADGVCDPAAAFTFLAFFLDEAKAHWRKTDERLGAFPGPDPGAVPGAVPGAIPGVLRSEVWAEPDLEGVDHQLEAIALRVGGQGVLAIAGVGLEFSQAQSILQTARERRLAMDRELAVRQLVESQLRQRVEQRTAELDATNRQLRSLASEVALAEQRERHRLAIGLHDHVGQLLAVMKMRLSSEAAKTEDAQAKERLADTIGLVAEAIAATRSLTFELSPPMLYELGLVPTLASLVEQTAQRHAPLVCTFEDDDEPKPLPTDVEVLLFQVVRELITNALKHAGAEHLRVSTRRVNDGMEVRVEDDGRGFDVAELERTPIGEGGFGLLSVRERLSHFGASLRVESEPSGSAVASPSDSSTRAAGGASGGASGAGAGSGGGGGGVGTRATIVVPLKNH